MAAFYLLASCFVMISAIQAAKSNDAMSNKFPDTKTKSNNWAGIPEKVNTFGIELQKRIREKEGNGQNIIFSPFSLFTAFSAVCLGAKDETKKEMASTLNWGDNEEFLKYMSPWFQKMANNDGSKAQLSTANRLWLKEVNSILPKYTKDLKVYFEATFGKLDKNEPEKKINDWVSSQTRGNIENLIPPRTIDALTRIVLVNAVHFKGKWASEFKKSQTRDGIFCLLGSGLDCLMQRADDSNSNNNRVRVKFMRQEAEFSVSHDRDAKLIEMPYSGGLYSMYFILPSYPGKINELEQKMTTQFLNKLIGNSRNRNIILRVPKFEVELGLDLDGELMQMKNLFDATNADLRGFNGKRDLYVSKAVHKAKLTVDEEGTEASGATGTVISSRSRKPEFVLNRPFLYYLMHKPSKTIVFAGKMMNPITG